MVNVPALITWLVTLAACYGMGYVGVHLFFRWLPGWFIAVILYIVLCHVIPRTGRGLDAAEDVPAPAAPAEPVRKDLRPMHGGGLSWLFAAVALAALAACLLLPLRVLFGSPDTYDADMASFKTWFLVATIVYFFSAVAFVARRNR